MTFFKSSGSTIRFLRAIITGFVFRVKTAAVVGAQVIFGGALWFGFKMRNMYTFQCWRRAADCDCHGCDRWRKGYQHEIDCSNRFLAWTECVPNLVFDGGINDLLTNYFKGAAYTAAFFVGLVDNASFSAYAAADTMASHAGWLESTAYSNATRPSLTLGSVASKSVDNSASKAVFNINATATIEGAFVTTNSTKGGTTGIAYGGAAFTQGNRSVVSGDTLNVQVTLTGA